MYLPLCSYEIQHIVRPSIFLQESSVCLLDDPRAAFYSLLLTMSVMVYTVCEVFFHGFQTQATWSLLNTPTGVGLLIFCVGYQLSKAFYFFPLFIIQHGLIKMVFHAMMLLENWGFFKIQHYQWRYGSSVLTSKVKTTPKGEKRVGYKKTPQPDSM